MKPKQTKELKPIFGNHMKKYTLFIFALLMSLLSASAQEMKKHITLGFESSAGVVNPAVTQLIGTGFEKKPAATIGQTGITVGVGVGKKTEAEFGRYIFMLYDNQAYFSGNGYGWSSWSGITATSYSLKIKQTLFKRKRFEMGLFAGFSTVLLDLPQCTESTDFTLSSWGSAGNGTTTIHDSTFRSMTYLSNRIVPLQYGLHARYYINKRLSIAAGLMNQYTPGTAYAIENVYYTRDGENPSQALISHTGNGYFLSLGLRYHWRNLVKVIPVSE